MSEAQIYVQQQTQVNMDETSFAPGNNDGKNPQGSKSWLWVMVTPLVSYFAVCLSRSGAVCQQLLGNAFAGIVGSDREECLQWLGIAKPPTVLLHISNATLLAFPNAVELLGN